MVVHRRHHATRVSCDLFLTPCSRRARDCAPYNPRHFAAATKRPPGRRVILSKDFPRLLLVCLQAFRVVGIPRRASWHRRCKSGRRMNQTISVEVNAVAANWVNSGNISNVQWANFHRASRKYSSFTPSKNAPITKSASASTSPRATSGSCSIAPANNSAPSSTAGGRPRPFARILLPRPTKSYHAENFRRPESNHSLTLQLEGRVVGPWVEELRHTCEPLLADESTLMLDLAEVSLADENGVRLLTNLGRRGVNLLRPTPFVAEQLRASPSSALK